MKLVLLLLAVIVGILLWRSRTPSKPASTPQRQEPKTDDMLSCTHCALHIPGSEAFPGKRGIYCSAEHRQLAES